MKKAVSIFLVSMISTSIALAQQGEQTEAVSSAKTHVQEVTTQAVMEVSSAENALKSLLSEMNQYRATFNQTVIDAQQNIVHEAQGVLTMTRPNKLRWETTFPDETLLIADGDSVWNVDTFVEQVTVLSQKNAIKDNPIVLLTASDDATWSKFSITEVTAETHEITVDNRNTQAFRSFQVTPYETGGQINTLTLTFNEQSELIALTMLDTQQQTSKLMFKNVETRFFLAAETFTVDVPESFIVDDQR